MCAHTLGVAKSYLERTGLVMNSVYVLRLSFDEWVGGQGDLSENDRVNVVSWLDTLTADSDIWAIVAGMPIYDLVALVCD